MESMYLGYGSKSYSHNMTQKINLHIAYRTQPELLEQLHL